MRDTNINVIGNYIFGLPEDDFDSMDATLKLALELNAEFANFYCAMAYPGSPLYRMALDRKWKLPETWPAGIVSVAIGVWTFILPYFYVGD